MVETGNFPPPKPAAPAPAPSPANPSSKSPSREDGELSSGEDAELTTSTAVFANKALSEPILVSTRNGLVRNLQTGNSSSIANTKFHTSTKRYYDKTFRTKQVPFKLNKNRALSWHKKISDDNLVISFSDDDSGTDSENSKPEATTEKKDNAVRSVKCKMPLTLSRRQHEILHQSTQFGTRLKSNKGVAGRVPFSSTGKNNGSNFGPPRTSSSEKVEHIQKQITALKSSISQVHGQIRDTVLADSAVESLRHQIALRENELNVQMKSLAQTKDRVTGSYNDHLEQLNQKLDNQVADIDGTAAANAKGLALNIRPTKRLKLDEHLERIQGSDGLLLMQEHSTKSMAESHQQLMGESSYLEVNSVLGYDGSGKGKRLSIINQEINKSHRDVNENVLGSSKVKHAGLEDNEMLLPTFVTDSTLYADPEMNSKQEVNSKITGDASCSYLKSDKGPELLASALLDQSLYLAQTGPALEGGISEWGTMNLESLLEMEELQDKELEEAQELRRQCELEERHALKAYRKAQRALIKANERCVILHRNREIITAKLQTLMLESSNSIWPSNKQGHGEIMLFSRLGYSIPTKGQTSEHLGDKLNHNFSDGAPLDASYKQIDRHGSCANQFSEPDDSTSEQRDKSAANGLGSPFQNLSTDDDEENLALDNRYVESNLACLIDVGNHVEETSVVDVNKDGDSQDYDLEAALRSKLVARFGMRTSCKSADISNIECQVDRAINSKVEKSCTSFDQQLQEQKKTCVSNPEGISEVGGSMNLSSVEHCGQSQQCMFSLKSEAHRNDDPAESSSFLNETCLSISKPILSVPSSILHNVLPLLKLKIPACHSEVSITKEKGSLMDESHEVTACLPDAIDDYTQRSARNPVICEMSYSLCDPSIDPFWPFCLFELRGKCNNDECPWQHVKQCTKRKLKQDGFLVTYNTDVHCHALTAEISHSALESVHDLYKHFVPIPAYYIGSTLIKVDSHLYHSVLARSIWQYWQRGFSASFPLPFSIQRILPQDAPFLQTSDDTVADYDSWSRHSWYLQCQDGKMKKFIQGLPDSEQSLELALDLFCGKFYKPERKKALSVLSRAIEADPNSICLWVVYLHIFYRKEKSIGKDDMFFHAVQHNGCSHELWLMYINSRVKVNDRLDAYNDALSMLCQKKLICDKELKYRSACVLDIFLQMVDCFCMCGSVEKVVRRIYQLSSASDSEQSGDTVLAEILSCLTFPDQCIFWICCIYLVMYKKLPQEIIQHFEVEKDLPFSIDWPFVQLTTDETDRVGELMKFALQRVALDVDENHQKRDTTALRSLHFLAVSHVRFVTALNGFHRSAELLVKYMELYPTCVELVLLSVRLQENGKTDVFWRGFEDILCNWPKEVPGFQCLWNQYIEHELVKGTDCAEKLIDQWFQQFGELIDPQCRNLEGKDADFCRSSEQPLLVESAGSDHTNSDDKMFGLINLSLHRMFKNDVRGACNAVDEALKLASPKYYRHCLREHAALFLLKGLKSPHNIHGQVILDLLNIYFGDTRILPRLELLSRRYYQSIKKSRIRQLIDEIIGSVPADFSLLNYVLEACYGPTFLPEKIDPKDLVDFVESLMEFTPANYRLALSVYKFIARNYSDSGVASDGIVFWGSCLLVNSIFQSAPVAPESVWLEAAALLRNSEVQGIAERFYQQALSVYPFSVKLWKSYLDLSKMTENEDVVTEAARERGLELNTTPD
ncbi:uncharacterized protein LOC135631820 isoform X1 [Musa acuminata AAA Group]|uniref:uncharacterized protein LOC135631820 isoform X1 n=1 Tax=Musa acuminata AAA Group TaxID=214697 RepID=UPI0031E1B9E8